ncbi:hypothetical protein COLO4_11001 [Corchorus olitorius]|uniref:Uncharacterized protein n=1 Tax=Corchorus olitorius TaxID=93759 RepID=A0A1R3K642_9ROSI|nr:hypothetical protein COLO4_11001 [Corchorus olitorius]
MNKTFRRRSFVLCLVWFIILSQQIQSVVCDIGQQNNEDQKAQPSVYQVVSNTLSLLKKSHKSSWEKIKTIMHNFQLQFTPPNLDFRGAGNEEGNMKEAVKKSVGTSKATVEETAKSAADMAGDAVHKTKEKVKGYVSDEKQSNHDEL